jgi:hypothetical protein
MKEYRKANYFFSYLHVNPKNVLFLGGFSIFKKEELSVNTSIPPLTSQVDVEPSKKLTAELFKKEVLDQSTFADYHATIIFKLKSSPQESSVGVTDIWNGIYKSALENQYSILEKEFKKLGKEASYADAHSFIGYKKIIHEYLNLLFLLNPPENIKLVIDAVKDAKDFSRLIDSISEFSVIIPDANLLKKCDLKALSNRMT